MLKFFMIIIALWMLVIQNNCYSAEVNCYSGKTRIYHGYGNDFIFSYNLFSFLETKTKHIIIMTADCLIMVPDPKLEKFDAIDLRERGEDA